MKPRPGQPCVQAQGLLKTQPESGPGSAPSGPPALPHAPSKPPQSACPGVTEAVSKQTHRLRQALNGGALRGTWQEPPPWGPGVGRRWHGGEVGGSECILVTAYL